MRLIVGLGNPGSRYAFNRHNAGHLAVEVIARRHRFAAFRAKFESTIAEGTIAGERIYLLKPQTFMNLSGDAVGACARFYKFAPEEIAVIHDETDLAPGKLKVKRGGGTAGHNGLRSIEAAIGADFWRVRIGVGHPGLKELVEPYVLQNFDAEEKTWLAPLLEAISEAAPLLVADDAAGFMTRVALILRPPQPKPAPKPAPKPPTKTPGAPAEKDET
jgi:peptidyl-tRNA hydrolase, PTH1 family